MCYSGCIVEMPQLLDWKLVSTDGGWHKRRKHATVVYQGSIYIIGGFYAGVGVALNLNDVWKCDDGVTWTRGMSASFSSVRRIPYCRAPPYTAIGFYRLQHPN